MMHAPTTRAHHVPQTSNDPSIAGGTGGRLVTTTGRALPLLGTVLSADAEGGIARVTLEQRFRNPHAEPLAVTYSLPLPAEGAVSGFCFTIGGRRVVGEIDRKKAARERYEQALFDGKSAALLEQDRSSLFTQEIGNIPPGVEVVVEVSIDQRLVWLHEGAWEWRFPTVVAPRYLGEPGRVADADRVTQEVADGPLPARFALGCTVRDRIAEGRRPESPTHAIDISPAQEGGGSRVALRDKAGARLDRDVVVRWHVATPRVGLSLATSRPAAGRASASSSHGLLTIVPPSVEGRYQPVARDLIVLLDTSGSMGGEPLSQAVRVVSAIVETLRDRDRIELIEFGSSPRRWKAHAVHATEGERRDAIAWLKKLRASGATEMRSAIVEALASTREGAQRQIVLVTDGLIGFESQVVAAICDRLPTSSRLHTVGVGSSVNRSLTGPAARAGHGVEVVIGLGEDPERAASRVVARTSAPLLVDLALSGSALVEHTPSRLPDLFANAPALVSLALRPEGGDLVVRGRTPEGSWEQRVRVEPRREGEGNPAFSALYAREKVEDFEMRLAAGGDVREIDRAIEGVGIDFQISTRLTSWVAVSEEQTVDPSDPLRRERMPHELPHGMSAEGLGLRPVMAAMPAMIAAGPASFSAPMAPRPPRMAPKTEGGFGYGGGSPPPAGPMPRARKAGESPREAERERERERREAPRSPAPKAKGRGFIDAVKDFFSSDDDESEERTLREEAPMSKEAEARKEAKPEPLPVVKVAEKGAFTGESKPVTALEGADGSSAAPGRVLRGRVALQRDGLLVIEILAAGEPLAWEPANEVRVALTTGRVFTATLDAARSTKRGTVPKGATARLALTIAAGEPLDPVLSVTLDLGGVIVVIEV